MNIGAQYFSSGKCRFQVWAPLLKKVELQLKTPQEKTIPMERREKGYWVAEVEGVPEGARYMYRLEDSREWPDPGSFFQPEGVHKASAVVNHESYIWKDAEWKGIALEEMIFYELHVGTFTSEGTFEAAICRLDDLRDLGINAIELMPVAQFPGKRNWGYDGVYPYAVQNSYGGVEGLKRLIEACHQKEIAVVLDVVYNHLGPEGNYLWDFAPYFSDHYRTPWSWAINFDGAYADGVREYFIQNALYWMREFHIDALRLDALHAVYDFSAKHFLEELAEEVKQFSKQSGKKHYLIAETSLNDTRLIRSQKQGGYALDAQWADDFHHALRTLLTRDQRGYYADFGNLGDMAKAFRQGYVYDGQYSVFRKRCHGNSPSECPASQFIVFSQNHDQVGNRMLGDRPSSLLSFSALKLMAGAVMLSPYLPMLFMGEEYGETNPFPYFVDHSDENLIKGVREGRKKEFEDFHAEGEPPDPVEEETFKSAVLSWERRKEDSHQLLLNFYKELIQIRKTCALFRELASLFSRQRETEFDEKLGTLSVQMSGEKCAALLVVNFNSKKSNKIMIPKGNWKKLVYSEDEEWGGDSNLAMELDSLVLLPLSLAFFVQNKI